MPLSSSAGTEAPDALLACQGPLLNKRAHSVRTRPQKPFAPASVSLKLSAACRRIFLLYLSVLVCYLACSVALHRNRVHAQHPPAALDGSRDPSASPG